MSLPRPINSCLKKNQTQMSVSENVGSAADSIMYSFYTLCQPPTQCSVSPVLTSKFDLKILKINFSILWNLHQTLYYLWPFKIKVNIESFYNAADCKGSILKGPRLSNIYKDSDCKQYWICIGPFEMSLFTY